MLANRIPILSVLLLGTLVTRPCQAAYDLVIPAQEGTLTDVRGQPVSRARFQVRYLSETGFTARVLATWSVTTDLRGRFSIPGRRFRDLRPGTRFRGVEVSLTSPIAIPLLKRISVTSLEDSGLSSLASLRMELRPPRPLPVFYQPFPVASFPTGLRRR